jgi:hypothetical protein
MTTIKRLPGLLRRERIRVLCLAIGAVSFGIAAAQTATGGHFVWLLMAGYAALISLCAALTIDVTLPALLGVVGYVLVARRVPEALVIAAACGAWAAALLLWSLARRWRRARPRPAAAQDSDRGAQDAPVT